MMKNFNKLLKIDDWNPRESKLADIIYNIYQNIESFLGNERAFQENLVGTTKIEPNLVKEEKEKESSEENNPRKKGTTMNGCADT
jgi:hypothetical protein